MYSILLLELRDVQLDPSKVKTYESVVSRSELDPLPLFLKCLFIDSKYNKPTEKLLKLDQQFSLLSNIQLLSELSVKSQVMHAQKVSVLSDMFKCIIQLLSFDDVQFETLLNCGNPNLTLLTTSKDILANLFIYSFNLREELNKF